MVPGRDELAEGRVVVLPLLLLLALPLPLDLLQRGAEVGVLRVQLYALPPAALADADVTQLLDEDAELGTVHERLAVGQAGGGHANLGKYTRKDRGWLRGPPQ